MEAVVPCRRVVIDDTDLLLLTKRRFPSRNSVPTRLSLARTEFINLHKANLVSHYRLPCTLSTQPRWPWLKSCSKCGRSTGRWPRRPISRWYCLIVCSQSHLSRVSVWQEIRLFLSPSSGCELAPIRNTNVVCSAPFESACAAGLSWFHSLQSQFLTRISAADSGKAEQSCQWFDKSIVTHVIGHSKLS